MELEPIVIGPILGFPAGLHILELPDGKYLVVESIECDNYYYYLSNIKEE